MFLYTLFHDYIQLLIIMISAKILLVCDLRILVLDRLVFSTIMTLYIRWNVTHQQYKVVTGRAWTQTTRNFEKSVTIIGYNCIIVSLIENEKAKFVLWLTSQTSDLPFDFKNFLMISYWPPGSPVGPNIKIKHVLLILNTENRLHFLSHRNIVLIA